MELHHHVFSRVFQFAVGRSHCAGECGRHVCGSTQLGALRRQPHSAVPRERLPTVVHPLPRRHHLLLAEPQPHQSKAGNPQV